MDLYESRKLLNSGKGIFDIPMRVTYYARVSTDKDAQLHSLSAQVKYYTDFISSNPNWTFVDGYIDEGLSGTSVSKRESFLRMIDDAKSGKFDFIVTKEISRFSRNTLDSIKYTQELLNSGVAVLFENDNINTLHADSELRLTIMSSIAQDEVRRISERTRFGFKRSIENGVVLGSSNIWGYEKSNGKLVIVEKEAEIVRHVFNLYANEKKGSRAIAKWLDEHGYKNSNGGEFSDATILKMISNPKYKGYYCGGKSQKLDYRLGTVKKLNPEEWIIYKDADAVPPIVSEELWEKANVILQKRSGSMSDGSKTSYQNKYAYSGKILCTEHDLPYHHAITGNPVKRSYWRCKRKADGKMCSSPVVYTDELDEVMRQVMSYVFSERENIANKLLQLYVDIGDKSGIDTEIAKLKVEIDEIFKKKDKLLDLSVAEAVTNAEFKASNDEFNAKIGVLGEKIEKLEQEKARMKDFSAQVKSLRERLLGMLSFEGELCGEVIAELLDRIEVHFNKSEKNTKKAHLKIYLKVYDDAIECDITRKRGSRDIVFCQTPSSLRRA